MSTLSFMGPSSSAPQPRKPATYQDLVALPENLVGELIGGELYASPRPASRQAKVSSILRMDLGSPFQRGLGGPGGWWVFHEPELHFGDDVLVPDLAPDAHAEHPGRAFLHPGA